MLRLRSISTAPALGLNPSPNLDSSRHPSRLGEAPVGRLLPRSHRQEPDPGPTENGLGSWLARVFHAHRRPVTAVILGAAALPGVAQVATATPLAELPPTEPPQDGLSGSPVGVCHPAFGAANPSLAIETLPRDQQSIARWLDETVGNADGAVSGRELARYLPGEGSSAVRGDGPMDRLLRAFAQRVGERPAAVRGPESSPRALELARELTRAGGQAEAADVALLVAEVARAPAPILERAQRAGITFVATRDSVLEHLPQLRGERPRGWDVGRSWDLVPGLYHPAEREVVIIIRSDETGRRCVPPMSTGHGSDNLVLHELGHALDYRRAFRSVHSGASDFQAAYASDRQHLLAEGESYLLQEGRAGREEAFAESFGRYFARDPDMASELPALHAYWQAFELSLPSASDAPQT